MPLKRESKLYCFSPPVMIATCVIELGLAVYTFVRYAPSLLRTIVVVLLLCLASFQLAEFQICQGSASGILTWTKIGMAGISILPALGMHLIGSVTRKSPLIPFGYACAVAFTFVFLFVPGATEGARCMGNYVILNVSDGWIGRVYEFYYLGFVGLAMLELVLRLRQRGRPNERGYSRRLIGFTLFSFLSFTVPMAIAAVTSAALRRATPSVMCGFALFFAVIVAVYVTPVYVKERARRECGEAGRR